MECFITVEYKVWSLDRKNSPLSGIIESKVEVTDSNIDQKVNEAIREAYECRRKHFPLNS